MPGARAPVDRRGCGRRGGPARGARGGSGRAGAPAPGQQLAVDAERGELVGGQVDAAAVEVLADVAQEVRELERHAERGGGRLGLRARHDRAQDRQHLQPDHRRRAVDVDGRGRRTWRSSVTVGVHPHRHHEVGEVAPVDVVAAGGVGERGEHAGAAAGAPSRAASSSAASASSSGGLLGDRAVVAEVVDDLVGVAGEAVERVHGRPPGGAAAAGWRGSRCGRVRALSARQRGVGGPQRRVGDPGGVELSPLRCPARRPDCGAGTAGGAARPGCGRAPRRAAAGRAGSSDTAASARPARHSRRGRASCRGRPRRWGSRRSPASASRTPATTAPGATTAAIASSAMPQLTYHGQRGGREHRDGQQHDPGPADRRPGRRRARPTTAGRRSHSSEIAADDPRRR